MQQPRQRVPFTVWPNTQLLKLMTTVFSGFTQINAFLNRIIHCSLPLKLARLRRPCATAPSCAVLVLKIANSGTAIDAVRILDPHVFY